MTPQELANLAHLRRARDFIDREYARPLDVPTMAAGALMSPPTSPANSRPRMANRPTTTS